MTLKQKEKVQSITLQLSEQIFTSNDCISQKLFSSNWMSDYETSVFLSRNSGHSFNIKMDRYLWNLYERAALTTQIKT